MATRSLRVLKWLAQVPAEAVCTHCSRNFKVPLTALTSVSDSQESLRLQFAEHVCKHLDSSQNALRIVREATENK